MAQAQGALSQIIAMRETSFKTLPSAKKSKKIYFTKEGLKFSQDLVTSNMIRGGSRHPSQALRGNTDVGGSISTELNANTMLFFAALGSMESTMTGGTMGAALTTPTAVIDATNCVMTVTVTSHGLVAGDTVEITGLTAPTSLNSKVFAVFDAPTVDTFKVAIPVGTTTTFTLGSGAIKKVTAAGTVFTHTLKAGGALPSYTVEKGFPDVAQYFKYTGCVCSKLSFGVPAVGMIDVTADFMGGAEAAAGSSFDSGTPTDNGKRSFDGLGIAAADMKEGGSPIAIVTKIDNITIDNALDGDTFVVGGGGSRSAINPGVYKVTGSLTAMFEDLTLYNKAKNLTETSLDVTLTRGTGAGTDNNESFQIVIPELNYKANAPAIEGAKGVVVSLDFEGYYDNGADATALKMIIKNAILPGAMI